MIMSDAAADPRPRHVTHWRSAHGGEHHDRAYSPEKKGAHRQGLELREAAEDESGGTPIAP